MSSPIVELTDLESIDRAVAQSGSEPVIVFKHSRTCGTSAMAHEEILDLVAAGDVEAPIYIVDVRAQRAVSNAIAARFALRHESPQVLLLRHGRLVWSASHFRVTASAIAQKLREQDDSVGVV